jgi:hypothetical protein
LISKSSLKINPTKLFEILATFDAYISGSNGFTEMTFSNKTSSFLSFMLLFLGFQFIFTTDPDFLN